MTDFTATSCSCRSTAVLEPNDRLDSEHRDVADEKSLCSRCLIGSIEMPSRYSREEIKFYRDVALAPIYPSLKRHRADDFFTVTSRSCRSTAVLEPSDRHNSDVAISPMNNRCAADV
jgi:hypothetical protein